ncbi:MAG TPA: SprT family zinc-dependent metalloprotease [Sphingomicrobium sp.]|nr:SprT family zinc-dependent metalloprotease [Sphingomicrobium sp.]
MKIISSTARSRSAAFEQALPVPLVVQPVKSARVLRLRFDAGRGILKLTCPARMSRHKALAWAADQQEWIDAQLAKALPAIPFAPGSLIPIEGRDVAIAWSETDRRTPRLEGDVLRCGGPAEGLAKRIENFLKRRAVDLLSSETAEFAALAGVRPRSVGVGDADTRWGSCSASGRIRYSWRLVLAPPAARRFVVAHEVAHLVHLNHGRDFKTLERRLYGAGLSEAQALLRRVGPRLKRVGRGL